MLIMNVEIEHGHSLFLPTKMLERYTFDCQQIVLKSADHRQSDFKNPYRLDIYCSIVVAYP